MDTPELLHDAFDRVREVGTRAATDLSAEALAWRPDPAANSIAWLVWHLARQADVQVADLAGTDQAWAEVDRTAFGLDPDDEGMGFGDTPEQVARVRPADPSPLVDHLGAVVDRAQQYVAGLTAADLDEVVDRNWDPPVTRGVRLVSVVGDGLQHAGQAAYVRGLWERR